MSEMGFLDSEKLRAIIHRVAVLASEIDRLNAAEETCRDRGLYGAVAEIKDATARVEDELQTARQEWKELSEGGFS